MNTPAISVVMPAYNAEKYLREAIESILNQTFSNFEFIIINDGSTDKTKSIILSYSDHRIIYIENSANIGISNSLNNAFTLAKGKYIARMDADDISALNRLEQQFVLMENNLEIGVSGTNIKYFSQSTEKIKSFPLTHDEIKLRLSFGDCPIAHPTVILRRDIYHNNKFSYSSKKGVPEDIMLWYDMLQEGVRFANIDLILLNYRIGSSEQLTYIYKKIHNEYREIIFSKSIKKIFVKIDDNKISKYKNIFIKKKNFFFYFKFVSTYKLLTELKQANKVNHYFNESLLAEYLKHFEPFRNIYYHIKNCIINKND